LFFFSRRHAWTLLPTHIPLCPLCEQVILIYEIVILCFNSCKQTSYVTTFAQQN
jgi:hypothetical protein